MPADPTFLKEIALTQPEYDRACQILGREPNRLETGMIALLWSEHCGYKHSRALLGGFPSTAPWVLIGPGEENAGAVDIGDGLAIVFKVESHNHPSAIEPYQGAATGVGGIIRDIFAMGARPIALLNALFFGPLTEPRNRYIYGGVVSGIGGYGNCMGIPDVGGQVTFDSSYTANPLVNAMCVGIARHEDIIRATASGVGNLIMLVGSDTGRDGIHGANFASVDLTAESEQRRPAVQVGNPFLEKLLVEACLEVAQSGYLVGMQDLGAGGLTSAALECAERAGEGMEVDVALVPRRETGMTAYEVMLSESQERMLVVVEPRNVDSVKKIFDKYDLHSTVIGHVTDDGLARIKDGDAVVAEAPVKVMTNAPRYRLTGIEDPSIVARRGADLSTAPAPADFSKVLLDVLRSPNMRSRREVFQQYDHQVGNNTVVAPGGDAAVLRVKGTKKGIALKMDTNSRYCFLDPFQGGAIAVAEAARNVSSAGARPLALTNCLNFGNPERAPVYYQLEQAIKGMSAAAQALGIPVISGNVSLYNESEKGPIYPTPLVGMMGLLDDVEKHVTPAFKQTGDVVYVIGASSLTQEVFSLAGSEYLALVHRRVEGAPTIDLDLEAKVQAFVRDAIAQGLLRSSHDVADGGLAVAAAESCIWGGLGLSTGQLTFSGRADAALFGEAQSRFLVSCASDDAGKLEALARERRAPLFRLGIVGGEHLRVSNLVYVPVESLAEAWQTPLSATA